MRAMDWYSWLSKTNLDPYLVYEYGRTFTQNELQRGDTTYFNHEFLKSMGITVAKHRLEILKLAKKTVGGCPNSSFSKLVSAIIKTRMLLTKKIGRCVSHNRSLHAPKPDQTPARPPWPSGLRRNMGLKENKEEKAKRMMKSGPLDGIAQESYLSPNRVLSISGPLDRKVQENLMLTYSSPMHTRPNPNVSGPLDEVGLSPRVGIPCNVVKMTSDDGVPSLWSLMFHDMKPT